MRSRGVSFADAVELLGGDAGMVAGLSRAAGVAGFFAHCDDLVRWGNAAAQAWRDNVHGLNRFDRTDRLIATHSVIVLVSFFEAFDDWPGGEDEAGPAADDRLSEHYATMVHDLVEVPPPYQVPNQLGNRLHSISRTTTTSWRRRSSRSAPAGPRSITISPRPSTWRATSPATPSPGTPPASGDWPRRSRSSGCGRT